MLKATGNCHYRTRDYRSALEYYERALQELPFHTDESASALRFDLHWNIATTCNRLGRWAAAIEHLPAALRLLEPSDRKLTGQLLYGLGWAYRGLGDLQSAESATLEAIVELRATGDESEQLAANHNLAIIRCERGRWHDGFNLLRYCELQYRRRHDNVRLARVLEEIGRYHLTKADLAGAEAAFAESRDVAEAAGERYQTARSTLRLSEVVALRGALDLARQLRRHALDLFATMGVRAEDIAFDVNENAS